MSYLILSSRLSPILAGSLLLPFIAPAFSHVSCRFSKLKSTNQRIPQRTSHLLALLCAPPGISCDGQRPLPELSPICFVELNLARPALRRADSLWKGGGALRRQGPRRSANSRELVELLHLPKICGTVL